MAVAFVHHTEHATKVLEHLGVFAFTPPLVIGCGSSLRRNWDRGPLIPVIEKLVQGDFQRPSQFFQCLDSGDSMSVFNAGNVASKQSSPFFDVRL